MMTSDGNLNPPLPYKLVWGSLVAILTVATLASGSVEVAKAMAVTGAVPFSVVLLLQVVGFLRAIREEKKSPAAVRRKSAKTKPEVSS
jgi:choline-glycine betaine transporter